MIIYDYFCLIYGVSCNLRILTFSVIAHAEKSLLSAMSSLLGSMLLMRNPLLPKLYIAANLTGYCTSLSDILIPMAHLFKLHDDYTVNHHH